jgi:MscS family membrane protein
MDYKLFGLSAAQWLDLGISLLIVLFVLILGRWIVRLVVDKLLRRIARTMKTVLDDVIVDVLRLPLYLLALVLAIDISYKRLDFLPESWQSWEGDLFFVLYLVVGFIFAWRFIRNFFIWYGKEMATRTETDLDEQLMPFFRRIAMIILWMIGIIMVLGHFNLDISAMVTTLGIGSLAIALAAQESLSDTISGFLIMVDRPFRIGDRVEIQDLNTWGDVVDIGLRSSRIRTRDNRMVIVPNSVIGKSLIVNYSYPDTRYRIEIHIGLGYGTDIEKARNIIVKAVRGVDGVLPDKPVEALFLEFGDFALIFRVRWWLDSYYDTRRMFDKVNTAIYYALNEANIEIPFPQVGIHHIENQDNRNGISRKFLG